MTTEIVPFLEQIKGLDIINAQIRSLWDDWVYRPYIIANRLKKVCEEIEKDYKDGFKSYVDEQWEIPGGFEVRITEKKTFDLKSNPTYKKMYEELEAYGDKLKNATEQMMKWLTVVDENGEVSEIVPLKIAEVYTITKKN